MVKHEFHGYLRIWMEGYQRFWAGPEADGLSPYPLLSVRRDFWDEGRKAAWQLAVQP